MIDWDYREVLPDLKIGDTVSFLLEVADKYPDGPHVVRSDTRRITFLSKEDYLEQIQKKKDRLLSRVQTAYRQQRSLRLKACATSNRIPATICRPVRSKPSAGTGA